MDFFRLDRNILNDLPTTTEDEEATKKKKKHKIPVQTMKNYEGDKKNQNKYFDAVKNDARNVRRVDRAVKRQNFNFSRMNTK